MQTVHQNVPLFYTLLLLLGCPLLLGAQMSQEDLLKHLEKPFAPIPSQWQALTYDKAQALCSPLFLNPTFDKTAAVLSLMTRKTLHSKKENQRAYLEKLLVEILVARPELNYDIWKNSSKFPKPAFTPQSQQAIQKHLLSAPQYLDKWLMLAGLVLDDPTIIRQILMDRPEKPIQQAGKLALVRMGDQSQARLLLKNLKRIPINDNFVYDIAPLAIYTRNKQIIDFLVHAVIQNLGNCRPADAEIAGQISCSYRLIELLAPILEGFPLFQEGDTDWDSISSEQQMREARNWLKKNRNQLIIKNQHL